MAIPAPASRMGSHGVTASSSRLRWSCSKNKSTHAASDNVRAVFVLSIGYLMPCVDPGARQGSQNMITEKGVGRFGQWRSTNGFDLTDHPAVAFHLQRHIDLVLERPAIVVALIQALSDGVHLDLAV